MEDLIVNNKRDEKLNALQNAEHIGQEEALLRLFNFAPHSLSNY